MNKAKFIEYPGQPVFSDPKRYRIFSEYILKFLIGVGLLSVLLYLLTLFDIFYLIELAGLLYLLGLVTFYVAGIVFSLWFYKAYSNLESINDVKLEYRKKWAILGFFVPFANTFVPYQIAEDIVNYSCTENTKSNLNRDFPSVIAWWSLFLFFHLMPFVYLILFPPTNTNIILSNSVFFALHATILVIGAYKTLELVKYVTMAQKYRYENTEPKNVYSRKAVCPACDTELRTKIAKQCPSCLLSWHDPDNPIYINTKEKWLTSV